MYEAILASSDVALGTLALHRKGMSEAAPLKVREYLLRGIPVVIGYDDPDLADRPWFVLQLPNTESNVRDAVAEIRARIVQARNRGAAVLLVSEDLDEILQLSDRIVVMFDGKLALQTPAASADVGAIGRAMAGH